MFTTIYKIYGADGHRQAQSFGESEFYDWSTECDVRGIYVFREDSTRTNDYVIVAIMRNNEEQCLTELEGQLSDGMFENCRYGKVERIA